jgi:tetratricopeptide (TPR) repeat protein
VLPALAAVVIALTYLSDVYVRTARADTAASASERLATARTAERLNPLAVAPHYLQAGALEQLGRRAEARRELLAVLDLEPESFVALGLLGDLETRAGNRGEAREWYRRALYLNPRDTGLQQLAR